MQFLRQRKTVPETIITGGSTLSTGRGISPVSHFHDASCACTLLLASATHSSQLEIWYQASCRISGNALQALRLLGLEKVDLIINEVSRDPTVGDAE